FWYLLRFTGSSLEYARTMAFVFLSVSSLLSVWSFRSLSRPLLSRALWHNPNYWVPASAGFSFLLQLVAIYVPGFRGFFGTVPLSVFDLLLLLVLSVLTVMVLDLRKFILPYTGAYTSWTPPPRASRKTALVRAQVV
ncbi:MAG: cation transporting ATPase C-terminal domain-containing protein, partial [Acidobacteriota bacterium]